MGLIKYGVIIICILILLTSALFLNFKMSNVLGETQSPYTLLGWMYSQNYSWISMNFINCKDNQYCTCQNGLSCAGQTPSIPYAVNIATTSNEIYGYGWSSYVGWVCFGNGNNHMLGGIPYGCTGTPPNATPLQASFDSASGKISGWAKVLSLGDMGWISLGTSTSDGLAPSANLPSCYNCSSICKQWTPTGVEEAPTTTPCVVEQLDCKICFSTIKFDGINIPSPTVDSVGGGSGLICENCSDCTRVSSTIDITTSRTECQNNCSKCTKYGSSLNLNDGSVVGWAWNGYKESSNTFGSGWIHFNGNGEVKILAPWLETKYGSVFSEKGIRQWAGSGGNNATYCIFAQSIYGIKTASISCPNPISDINIKYVTSTATQNIYRNALGKIDIYGLTTSTNSVNTIKYNKYGNSIVDIDVTPLTGSISLDNKVFVSDQDVTIDGLTIKNGSKNGNGTIIINGNLTINGDIVYDNTSNPSNVKQLASIAWIVKGDLIISGNVKNVVGAFIVLGDGSSCKYDDGSDCLDRDYPKYLQNGYGTIFSGSSPNQLIVYGLIAAKAYDFRRQYADPENGSETIVYDGRLVANPPPGFGGFAESLPVIRDFQY
ncbi:MAG: hypothetical protein WCV92_04485 [Candidatus Buchananbacteria bacterium]